MNPPREEAIYALKLIKPIAVQWWCSLTVFGWVGGLRGRTPMRRRAAQYVDFRDQVSPKHFDTEGDKFREFGPTHSLRKAGSHAG